MRFAQTVALTGALISFGSAAIAADAPAPTPAGAAGGAAPDHPLKPCSDRRHRDKKDKAAQKARAAGELPPDPADQIPDSLAAGSTANAEEVRHAILCEVLHLRTLRDGLKGEIDDQRSEQAWFDSSVIALGIASVATAFAKASPLAIGGLGIAAAGVEQYRSYYGPEPHGAAAIKAITATRCVASNAEPLLNENPQVLWTAMATLRKAMNNVQIDQAFTSGAGQGAATAADAGVTAMTAATTELSALNDEASAFNSFPATIDLAHDAIDTFMDLARHRSVVVTTAGVATAVQNGIKDASDSAAKTQAARAQLMDALKTQAKAAAATPGATDSGPPAVAAPQNLGEAQGSKPPANADPQAGAGAGAGAGTGADTPPSAQDKLKAAAADASRVDSDPSATPQAKQTADAALAAKANATYVTDVSALIAATNNALLLTPSPSYTSIAAQIKVCITPVS